MVGGVGNDGSRDSVHDPGVFGGQHNERTDREAGEQSEEGRSVRLSGHHDHSGDHAPHVVSGDAVGERHVHSVVLPPAGAFGDRGRLQAVRSLRRTLHRGQRDAGARNRAGSSLLLRLLLRSRLVRDPRGVGSHEGLRC